MTIRARHIISAAICATIILLVAGLSSETPVSATDCGGVSAVIIPSDACGTSEQGPMLGILAFTIKLLAVLIGIAAVGAIIYAGVLYSSAGNNNTQVQKSKSIITSTVIGIVLFAGMAAMLNWLVPGGVFSDNPSSWSQVSSTQPDSTTSTGGTNSDTSGNSSTSGSSGTTNTIVTAATYNIRATDMTSWDSTRANAILNYIKTVDIVGIQEGRSDSVPWLTTRLKVAGYARTSNEWARNVFWDIEKFSLIKQGQKQLDSEKDLVWAKVKEKKSGKIFYFADVHLDVDSSANRTAELQTALKYMSSIMTDAPVIFVGDMNSERGSSQDKQIQRAGFLNAYDIAASKIHINYRTTLSGFKGGTSGAIDTSSNHQVDHIYIKGNLSVSRIEIVSHRGSDHLPVEADILLR